MKSNKSMGCNDKNGCYSCNIEEFRNNKALHFVEKRYERNRILIICSGNSCRSQMAEGWLISFDERLDVFSSGTHPEKEVNQYAIAVMKEVGIDISKNHPKHVNLFINDNFNFVITVCNQASTVCPVFIGNVKKHLHIGFEDPAEASGSADEIMEVYRKIRDQIRDAFYKLYNEMT